MAGTTTAVAGEKLAALERELAQLPSDMQEAAHSADARRMTDLRRRQHELSDEIFAARTTLTRLQMAELEVAEADAKTGMETTWPEVERTEAAAFAAKEEAVAARARWNDFFNKHYVIGLQMGRLRRSIEDATARAVGGRQ